MIILHNRHDKASREFVAAAPAVAQVLDWYNDADRQAWLDAGGTLAVSAFPSVLFRHDVRTSEDPETGDLTTEPPGWDVADTPQSLDTPLPAVGEFCAVGLYRYGEGWVYCRQAHTRQADWQPETTLALFTVWRPDSPDMIWIPGEPVDVGDRRIYGGVEYECIQAHVTQADWTPPSVPALWRVVTPPSAEWQPYTAYNVGDEVLYGGALYRCRQAHTSLPGWEPPNVPALWLPIV